MAKLLFLAFRQRQCHLCASYDVYEQFREELSNEDHFDNTSLNTIILQDGS